MDLEAQRQYMLSGRMYNDLSPELVQAREHAARLCAEHNRSGIGAQERLALLQRLLKRIGDGALVEPHFRCEFGFDIAIGKAFYANVDCVILDGGVEIGDHVLFGPRVGIYTSNHAIDAAERAAGGCYARPVRIGNRVWIGAGVHINPGVTIGDDTIIGSGSVVTRSMPAGVLAAGVPCRVLRAITDRDKTGFTG